MLAGRTTFISDVSYCRCLTDLTVPELCTRNCWVMTPYANNALAMLLWSWWRMVTTSRLAYAYTALRAHACIKMHKLRLCVILSRTVATPDQTGSSLNKGTSILCYSGSPNSMPWRQIFSACWNQAMCLGQYCDILARTKDTVKIIPCTTALSDAHDWSTPEQRYSGHSICYALRLRSLYKVLWPALTWGMPKHIQHQMPCPTLKECWKL